MEGTVKCTHRAPRKDLAGAGKDTYTGEATGTVASQGPNIVMIFVFFFSSGTQIELGPQGFGVQGSGCTHA